MLSGVDYDEVEIIVVNDGSTDRTLEKMLDAYPFEIEVGNRNPFISTAKVKTVHSSNAHKYCSG
jgi:glycosyltransferase involved in cell wall biosynthesis